MLVQELCNSRFEYKKENFKGKFVKLDNFTKNENIEIDRFIKYSWNKYTNEAFIKKKNYDIFITKNKKNNNIVLSAVMDRLYTSPLTCYIDTLNHGNDELNTRNFRNSIEWYEDYKKHTGGYNGFWEKLKVYIMGF